MPIRAGDLRTPLWLDRPDIGLDPDGGEAVTWPDSFFAWGKIEAYTGREVVGNEIVEGVDAKITVRTEQQVTPRWRVREADSARMYAVEAALYDQKGDAIVLLCHTVTPGQSDGR